MYAQRGMALALAGAAVYLIALLLHDIGLADLRLREAQAREAMSRLQTRDAQLQVLRAQINPHFLFNSLNSISALTTQSPADARTMTLELAAFFRKTLQSAESERIALSDEVALCTHFLAVEKIRYGDRLQTHIDIAEGAQAAFILPMLLQPCVENAVKHGIRHLPEGGCIAVQAHIQGPWLYVTVVNPADPEAPRAEGTGMGLGNIRQRVAAAYGERARVAWRRLPDSFSVEIVLPMQVPANPLLKDPLP
ncbi:MAG: hypothetical protein CFE44_07300 [Burkholderiales bacterium PBB4]|nr:MAG: hypothetical protein CFE44_07300 [Burkholderiales bacterium PBB4]